MVFDKNIVNGVAIINVVSKSDEASQRSISGQSVSRLLSASSTKKFALERATSEASSHLMRESLDLLNDRFVQLDLSQEYLSVNNNIYRERLGCEVESGKVFEFLLGSRLFFLRWPPSPITCVTYYLRYLLLVI